MRVVLIAGLALIIAGCATKRYPIATSLGAAEASVLTCRELEIELLRAEEVRRQISRTAEVDWRSVAGFLGDYGIGNAMAKNDADKAINNRVASIRAAQVEKRCNSGPVSGLQGWFQGLH